MIKHCRTAGCGWQTEDLDDIEALRQMTFHNHQQHPGKGRRGPARRKPTPTSNGEVAGSSEGKQDGARGSPVPAYRLGFTSGQVLVDPVVHLRYRTWVDQAAYTGTFAEFLNEATDLVTQLKGLVPAGYRLEGEDDE